MSADIAPHLNRLSVIYDGECPFCKRFAKFHAIRRNAGDIELINAREKPVLVHELRSKGMEINDGLVVIWRGHHYHGAEGMCLLSLLGAESGAFTMLNKFLFCNRYIAGAIYPALVAGRRLILLLLRRNLIPD
jgi:DCC1-like thiol-disulfide oxidoreductase